MIEWLKWKKYLFFKKKSYLIIKYQIKIEQSKFYFKEKANSNINFIIFEFNPIINKTNANKFDFILYLFFYY